MVLINKDKGVLTANSEFLNNPAYEFIDSTTKAEMGDILKVHDYNYLEAVKKLCDVLDETENDVRVRYGKNYCHLVHFR